MHTYKLAVRLSDGSHKGFTGSGGDPDMAKENAIRALMYFIDKHKYMTGYVLSFHIIKPAEVPLLPENARGDLKRDWDSSESSGHWR